MGPYLKTYKRCCREPLLRHKQLLKRSFESEATANWTLIYPNPSNYAMEDGTLRLAGYGLQQLGAVSMAESLEEVFQAVWDYRIGNWAEKIQKSQLLFQQGTSGRLGMDGEEYKEVFDALQSGGAKMTQTFLDIGANNGKPGQSPLVAWMEDHNSSMVGVAFEGVAERCAQYRKQWPTVEVHCGLLSAEKLYESTPSLEVLERVCSSGEPYCVDVWKTDIDGVDCTVLEILLRQVKPELLPKAMLLEVNTHFPPPFKFSISTISGGLESRQDFWARQMQGLYGCSLSYQIAALKDFGYWLIGFLHKDALFVHKSFAHAFNASDALDEFVAYSNAMIMTGNGISPRVLRQWWASLPHVGLGQIQAHLARAERLLSREVRYSLSI